MKTFFNIKYCTEVYEASDLIHEYCESLIVLMVKYYFYDLVVSIVYIYMKTYVVVTLLVMINNHQKHMINIFLPKTLLFSKYYQKFSAPMQMMNRTQHHVKFWAKSSLYYEYLITMNHYCELQSK